MIKNMSPRLTQHLENLGRLDTDGHTRKARLRTCRHCGARVVTGLDADHLALPATATALTLDPVAEYVALRLGRRTYNLTRTPTLDHRDPWMIRSHRHPVLPEHICTTGIPPPISASVLAAFGIHPNQPDLTDPPY